MRFGKQSERNTRPQSDIFSGGTVYARGHEKKRYPWLMPVVVLGLLMAFLFGLILFQSRRTARDQQAAQTGNQLQGTASEEGGRQGLFLGQTDQSSEDPMAGTQAPQSGSEERDNQITTKQREVSEVPTYASWKVGDRLVIKTGELPLYDQSGSKGHRWTTALFGEKAEILKTQLEDQIPQVQIRLEDGSVGWADVSGLSQDTNFTEESERISYLLVLSPTKRIMSHAISGTTLFKAPMGSVLTADYQSAEIYRLILPEGQVGWINSSGIEVLGESFSARRHPPQIPKPPLAHRLFVSSVLNYDGACVIPGGISYDGADMAGALYISARVNGLDLPRSLSLQAEQGEKVIPIRDPETGLVDLTQLLPGDVLFFSDPSDPQKVIQAAVLLEESRALTQLANDSTLKVRALENQTELLSRLLVIRRFFPQ